MSVYNTGRCRIKWTRIDSAGAATNVIPGNRDMTLLLGAYVDPGLRNAFNLFVINFTTVNSQGQPVDNLWTGYTPIEFPVFGNIWLSMSFRHSIDATGQSVGGLFLYRPSMEFVFGWTSTSPLVPGGAAGTSQFAVAPEDHYFLIE